VAKERSDQRLTVAQEDVKLLKSMILTLQVELAGVYVCACVCACVCVCERERARAHDFDLACQIGVCVCVRERVRAHARKR